MIPGPVTSAVEGADGLGAEALDVGKRFGTGYISVSSVA
jgi:hypothetical protein